MRHSIARLPLGKMPGMKNDRKKRVCFWIATSVAWLIWIGSYSAWVVWRADAPVEKDATFIYLVAPFWAVSALSIAVSEFRRLSTTRAIVSTTLQAIALVIFSTFLGIYLHFAAGGTS
jgi:hypothetical protein